MKRILFNEELLDDVLEGSRRMHPKELLLLLRGKVEKNSVYIDEFIVPPRSYHGKFSSGFNPFLLPIDPSLVGTVHSHPSGSLTPSIEDLNNFYGFLMVIVAYPYLSVRDVAVYDKNGGRLVFEVI